MSRSNNIDPELNRARVKECMERRGTERLNIYLDKGTLDRIKNLGLKGSKFAKKLILEELDRLESMK